MRKPTTPAKKTGKKRRWYFRHKRVRLGTVIKSIDSIAQRWKYANRKYQRSSLSVSRENVSEIVAISIEAYRANSDAYRRLTIIDLYVLYMWILAGSLDFSRFAKFCLYALNNPLIKRGESKRKSCNLHHACLEQDRDNPDKWRLHVRSLNWIKTQPDTYLILCLPIK